MIKLAVTGCRGRMGRRIAALAKDDGAFELCALLEHSKHSDIGLDIDGLTVSADRGVMLGADVLITFTSPDATMQDAAFCRENGIAIVIGTTVLTGDQVEEIKKASEAIPIVYSSNMSIGVNIVFKAVEMIAAALPDNYSAAMQEAHHIHKKDAPSGTAKTTSSGAWPRAGAGNYSTMRWTGCHRTGQPRAIRTSFLSWVT